MDLKKQASYNLRQKKLLSSKDEEEADTFSAILAEGYRQQCTVYEVSEDEEEEQQQLPIVDLTDKITIEDIFSGPNNNETIQTNT